jgi:uncharacterized peroxidase-related enzyme
MFKAGVKSAAEAAWTDRPAHNISPWRAHTVPHLQPRPRSELSEFEGYFQYMESKSGMLANSALILGHRPDILRATSTFTRAILELAEVPTELKQLMAHLSSSAVTCRYCEAHTARNSARFGMDERKIERVWDFETDPLFSHAERAALRLARDMVQVPNAVTEQHFADLREHFTDSQILEMVTYVSFFGFWNRFNDTIATPLEDSPIEFAAQHLEPRGWALGKHARPTEVR